MNVLKKIGLVMIIGTSLFASDSDFDGVSDEKDLCVGTGILDVVNFDGCSRKQITSKHGSVVASFGYAQQQDVVSLVEYNNKSYFGQLDYFSKSFFAGVSTSKYSVDSATYSDSGFNDTTIRAGVRTKIEGVGLSVGAGVVLDTSGSTNNETDYFVNTSIRKSFGDFSAYVSAKHTFIGDSDPLGLRKYRDTNTGSLGLGYSVTDKLYLGSSYYVAESAIDDGRSNYHSAGASVSYDLTTDLSASLTFSRDLDNDSYGDNLGVTISYKIF